jgi:hypothetical protein
MKARFMWMAFGLLLAVIALRSAGDVGYWRRYTAGLQGGGAEAMAHLVQPRLRLAGEAMELPRATPESELIEAGALNAAAGNAQQLGVRALLVHRHGHRVFEYYATGRDDHSEVQGGELSASLLALSLGALVDARRISPDAALTALRDVARVDNGWRNPWSLAARRRFSLAAPPPVLMQDLEGSIANTISSRVWQPLGAADAALWGVDDARLRLDCCVVARLEDWMRVGDLFLQQGSYQGQRVVSPDWMRQLLVTDAQGRRHPVWLAAQLPPLGDEPPAAREIYWFDLGADIRLWLVPRRSLAILLWTDNGQSRDTLIPNIILRGLQDQLPAGGAELNDLVPGH